MTLQYMLDTDTVSFALRGQGSVAQHLLRQRPTELCMSVVTLAELRYGADRRRSRKLHALIDTFSSNVMAVPFDAEGARHFGSLASSLANHGAPIGEFDTLIAAHAMALDLILVTNNMKHFGRVTGLRCENWL